MKRVTQQEPIETLTPLKACRIIAAQSTGPDWTADEAIGYAKATARAAYRAAIAAEKKTPEPAEALIDELCRSLADTVTALDYQSANSAAVKRVTTLARYALNRAAAHQGARHA